MLNHHCKRIGLLAVFAALLSSATVFGRVQYPVNPAYEDTVRIAILYNTPLGRNCLGSPPPVGQQTRDFIVASLDTNFVKNVKIIPAWNCPPADLDAPAGCTNPATIQAIQNMWPGKLPHVIVHSNAGWSGWNGPNMMDILRWAVSNYIGIVEIGDDAGPISAEVFGLTMRSGWPTQMNTAMWLRNSGDSLMLKIHPSRDRFMNQSFYPGLNGVVVNASRILGNSTFYFKPYAAGGRCEADADDWGLAAGFENKIVFLGYQQGFNATGGESIDLAPQGYVGAADQWSVLAALQDTIFDNSGAMTIRRGVALSVQPQYLANTNAAQQMVYDAIMYSSLAHTLKPIKVNITLSSDNLVAGSPLTLTGTVVGENLTQSKIDSLTNNLQWRIDNGYRKPGDSFTDSLGRDATLTATMAYRDIIIFAEVFDPVFGRTVQAQVTIPVLPGPASQIFIERLRQDGTVFDRNSPSLDSVLFIPLTGTSDTAAAVLRDRFNNFVSMGSAVTWSVENTQMATIAPRAGSTHMGIATKVSTYKGAALDSTRVIASMGALTPGTAKLRIEFRQQVAKPVAYPTTTTYRGHLVIDSLVTATPGASIWYCINCVADPVPNGPGAILYIPGTTIPTPKGDSVVIRAVGTRTNFDPSEPLYVKYVNLDNQGPIIESALLYLGNPPGSRKPDGKDTLIVYFNEPVPCSELASADRVFGYVGKIVPDSIRSTILDQNATGCTGGSMVSRAVLIVAPAGKLRPLQDSVRIVQLNDQYGNTTINGKPVAIKLGRDYDLLVSVATNPYIPGSKVIDEIASDILLSGGQQVTQGLYVKVELAMTMPVDSTSHVVFYDVVGNQVTEKLKVLPGRTPGTVYLVWPEPLMTRNGRRAASGTYLGVVRISAGGSEVGKSRVKVGIKR